MRLPGVHDDGESLVFAKREGRPLVLLAGHTDTVPAQANLPGSLADGSVVGLGASDMKGGLAVMVELANWAVTAELAYDLAVLFFPREELGPAENPLPGVFEAVSLVDDASLVVVPRADRQHAPARLSRKSERARRLRRTLGSLRAALATASTRSESRSRA